MSIEKITNQFNSGNNRLTELFQTEVVSYRKTIPLKRNSENVVVEHSNALAEILVLTSYPPRVCGIATYSNDLISALKKQFGASFSIKVCALESGKSNHTYPSDVCYTLDTTEANGYLKLNHFINQNKQIKIVLIQHEFGFYHAQEKEFLKFVVDVRKPVSIVFHTVLPRPEILLRAKVRMIAFVCQSLIVMTHQSLDILVHDYGIAPDKISVIAHGTHLVEHINKDVLKKKYSLTGRKVLSTFGLLSSGKSIETTLQALPEIIKTSPEVMFLVIGKTHPEVVKNDGERYREMLDEMVKSLGIRNNVRFINSYLSTPNLLEYLQLTDIYLFTTNDPNQAVSGTFAYAMSCACPIISTPIPHAKEVLTDDTGIIFDFGNSHQLAMGVKKLLSDDTLRNNISLNTLQKIISSAWENSAISHSKVFEEISGKKIVPRYSLPAINLSHLKNMTSDVGIIQFSKINHPDLGSGYTLDDNARALIALCMHYELTSNNSDLPCLQTYLNFIERCQLPSGRFENYIDKNLHFTKQNRETNLDDANGRAIWALGFLISKESLLPAQLIIQANFILQKALPQLDEIHSTRAMAFIIKGLFYSQDVFGTKETLQTIEKLAMRMVRMYKHESAKNWEWFESYLTYANSLLPEALLNAWLLSGKKIYKEIALSSFHFLLSKIFNKNGIEVISNKKWLQKGDSLSQYGEQPVDVAYTIMTLSKFYDVFQDEEYRLKMKTAFNWFLGENRLNQIIYNPCTGGCYDGLEKQNVNLNQGAESTISYLMARLIIEKYKNK
ncbi:MAG: glycosyltransferase [Prolixibacteraceae bacterium]|nr:glycosyltransferase [Prolixibacteraceae bacterium]